MIRLTVPTIEKDDLQAVYEVLKSGQLVQGRQVSAFEEAVANYVGLKYAIAVSNCTGALHLSLLALGVRPGDIVLVTAYSWISTANVIELCGAQPVFVDIDAGTFNLDPNQLKQALERLMGNSDTRGRVKALLPVHTFGQLADMSAIQELGWRYHVPVIEDAACALGAKLDGREAGTWGVMSCFSFHPRKAITTGEGGMITTDDYDLACSLRALRNHGQDPGAPSPEFIMPGFNYRMTEIQAALGLTQMGKLNRILAARRRSAAFYDKLLRGTSVHLPEVRRGSQPVYQSYVVLLEDRHALRRNEIINRLKEKGIETTIGTYHIPMTTYYRSRYGYCQGRFPVADQVSPRSLTLPLYEGLSEQEQVSVVASLLEALAS